jgi:prepilin signal peptidase PulO-like enzyme (type II secretory pathway)
MTLKRLNETEDHHGPLTRFFLRHAAFLIALYGPKDTPATWHYATMFVTIVLSTYFIFVLTLAAAFLPGRINLASLSPNEMGIGIAVTLAVTAVFVDARFRKYKFNLMAAGRYGNPSDKLKLFLTALSMFAAIVGYAMLLWWKKSN